jgi:(1->4)-alpha-D-glucan 1-alpha-D-glucosylmutase
MRHVLTSTYRLQLHAGFTFEAAAGVLSYLKSLGISHIYCSPYLQAAPGSMHGYDVVDHQKVNEELGGETGHRLFSAGLQQADLGQILDIVPNHMAVGPRNLCWWDVLENGPASRFASWFDIDWHSAEVRLQNKVLIPVLGDQYGRVLSAGQIQLERDGEGIRIRYAAHIYPLAPRSLPLILFRAANYEPNPVITFIADSFSRLPFPESTDQDAIASRDRDKGVIYELLRRLCEEYPQASQAIGQAVTEINADANALDELLNLQHYRLAYWRTADQELGYRRFFDVNSLIGLRVERPHVFDATHCLIFEWIHEGVLDGIRIDHPDGLRDPLQYFERLRNRAPDAWIIGEKILEPGEYLRNNWPIQGTTGYDFLNVCNGLLVHGEGLKEITEIYKDFTAEPTDFAAIALSKKISVQQEALGSDVNRLASLFVEICENNRDRRDYTRAEIRRAIREVAACFSVYRTYVAPGRNEVIDEDRLLIAEAVEKAKLRRTDIDAGLFDFMGDVLTLREHGAPEAEFVHRFQQFTSPVMAKGVEDTAFYCFNRMIGLNEVGSAPDRNGLSVSEFHDFCFRMQSTHPLTMTTLSTHDTKRSDDVRARLAVLTEIPGRWKSFLNRWSRRNAQFKTGSFPDRNTEYFLYQTLVGAWPVSKDRLTAYMEKAVREAKQQTSWTQNNKEFEDALRSFTEGILDSKEFIAELESFVDRVTAPGRVNSLTQTLLKCTAPGVPDTYQGSELWDLHLVDPDNRGAVDYELRRALLASLEAGLTPEEIVERAETGLPKLWTIYRCLNLRRTKPEWFGADASYETLPVDGAKKEHAIAYVRGRDVVTLASRWNSKLGGNWSSTTVVLPPGRWRNLLTGDVVSGDRQRIQSLLARFPVALFTREEE